MSTVKDLVSAVAAEMSPRGFTGETALGHRASEQKSRPPRVEWTEVFDSGASRLEAPTQQEPGFSHVCKHLMRTFDVACWDVDEDESAELLKTFVASLYEVTPNGVEWDRITITGEQPSKNGHKRTLRLMLRDPVFSEQFTTINLTGATGETEMRTPDDQAGETVTTTEP